MTFFDDNTSDSESHSDAPQLDPSTYRPQEIDIGVAATTRPDGGVALDFVTYIDGMPTPTYDDLLAGEPWANWNEVTINDDEPDNPAPPARSREDHLPVKDICEERQGWAVIRNPDDSEQWVAMPVDEVVQDLRSLK